MENTSGQGKNTVVPQEIKGLAWGAFFWNFIWGIFNRTWIALLALIPLVNLVMAFVLLLKGREWAWRNKRWDSVEHFNKIQRRWAIAGLIVILAPLVIFLILGFGFIVSFVGMMFGMQSAMDGAMKDAGKSKPEVSAPATSAVKKPVPPIAAPAQDQSAAPAAPKPGSAEADFDSLLGPALTGLEKPGTTRAGPAILELSQFFGDSVWITLHLPLIKGLDVTAPAPEVTVNSVLDASGKNFYDSTSSFEKGMFLRASLSSDSNPAPHFSGRRSVHIKPGLNEQALQKIEGHVRIFIPVDVKPVVFEASEAGKGKPVHGTVATLKSFSGAKVALHYRGVSKNLLEVRGYGKDGSPVEIESSSWSETDEYVEKQFSFKGPVSKVEAFIAARMLERQFPFTLVRGAVAGQPLPATGGAKPSVPAPGAAVAATEPAKPAPAADEPEAIYAKFHSAGLAANFNEMAKYGTASPELESMPAATRQAMLNFLAQMLPQNYSVAGKTIDPDGNHASLRLAAPGAATGTATLIKEKGGWKVDKVNWDGSPKTSEPPSPAATGGNDIKTKSKPAMRAKKGASPAPSIAAADVAAPEPQKKIITPKFNDVFTAVMYRDLPAVRELLDLGWWADKPEPGGSTPLMAAVGVGDTAIAELLLKHGANPNASARGGSALRLAKHNHNAAMVALLQRYGATVE